MSTVIGGAAFAQPTKAASYQQFKERELSTTPYHAPETVVPRALSFWPYIDWDKLGHSCATAEPGDATTAIDARRRLESAGYSEVRDLRRDCDNVWHGTARIEQRVVRVMLKPDGPVLESNP
ncbi:MAG: hypothetical protein IT562_16530 [Alphaproteobacteria bacterium]|nr:hypothetical protein [Alphaproteobacteria bacterium]